MHRRLLLRFAFSVYMYRTAEGSHHVSPEEQMNKGWEEKDISADYIMHSKESFVHGEVGTGMPTGYVHREWFYHQSFVYQHLLSTAS